MRAIPFPLAVVLLTGAAAPAGCVLNMDKGPDTAEDPDQVATFGRSCTSLEAVTYDLPEDVAYILEVDGVTVDGGEDVMTPIDDWSATADTITVTCPEGTVNFIASYATTATL